MIGRDDPTGMSTDKLRWFIFVSVLVVIPLISLTQIDISLFMPGGKSSGILGLAGVVLWVGVRRKQFQKIGNKIDSQKVIKTTPRLVALEKRIIKVQRSQEIVRSLLD